MSQISNLKSQISNVVEIPIEPQIRQYLAANFLFSDNGFELDDEASFLEEGVVDSTGVLELVMFVEEMFGITVQDEEIVPQNFDSVSQLAAYIRRKLSS
jgi:acyl carrier protein